MVKYISMNNIVIKIILSLANIVVVFLLPYLLFQKYFFMYTDDFESYLVYALIIIIILNTLNIFSKNKRLNYIINIINIFYLLLIISLTVFHMALPPDRIMLPLIIGCTTLIVNLFTQKYPMA